MRAALSAQTAYLKPMRLRMTSALYWVTGKVAVGETLTLTLVGAGPLYRSLR